MRLPWTLEEAVEAVLRLEAEEEGRELCLCCLWWWWWWWWLGVGAREPAGPVEDMVWLFWLVGWLFRSFFRSAAGRSRTVTQPNPGGPHRPPGVLAGGHARGAPPVPIPNTVVKPARPMILRPAGK